MKGFENAAYVLLYIISNTAAILFVIAAWKSPRLARILFFLLFAWAGYTNWKTALQTPGAYMGNAELAILDIYKNFIRGWFSHHITATVGFIASAQLLIAVLFLYKAVLFKVGCVAAIIFLLAIAPLGIGSAFPATVILALALIFLLRLSPTHYIWQTAQNHVVQNSFGNNITS